MFQDIKFGRETIGGKTRFDKNPTKPQKQDLSLDRSISI